MADETSAWEGVEIVPDKPRVPNQPIGRRRPEEERTLNAAKILAGLSGEKEQHAVRFKDLERMEQELLSRLAPSQQNVASVISKQIRSQFAAINTESKALVNEFNELFDIAQEDIDALGTEVDAEFDIFETALNGNSASIAILSASIDGVKAVWGIRTNVNGHVSGISLISSAVDGGAQTDFIIIDSSLRVVNTSGVGNYTPFAVYPTGRTVDGAFVPAGVHAEDLYVTRGNIAELAVDTVRIKGNAVTIPSVNTRTNIIYGNGVWRRLNIITLTMDYSGYVLILWNGWHGYTGVDLGVGFQHNIRLNLDYSVAFERGGIAITDYPTLAWSGYVTAGVHTVEIEWKGASPSGGADISIGNRTLSVYGVKK